MHVLIVANPVSGAGRAAVAAPQLAAELARHGVEASVYFTTPHDEDPLLDAAILSADTVVAVGGDGTLNRVVRPVVLSGEAGPAVAILPFGTGNVAVRAFGLPRDVISVARMVADGHTRTIDAGVVTREEKEPRVFMLWLGAGVDGAMIHGVAARRSGFRGFRMHLEYAIEGLRILFNYRFPPVRVEALDLDEDFGSVLLANIGMLAVGSVTKHADPGDGLVDLIATRPRSRLAWCVSLMYATVHQYDRCPGVERKRHTRVRLSAAGRVPLQLDGEPFGDLPVDVEMRPGAVRLCMPRLV